MGWTQRLRDRWFPHHHHHTGGAIRLQLRVSAMEDRMGDIEDQVRAITAQVTEYNEDVAAKLAELTAAIGTNPPGPIRDALLALQSTVAAGVSIVGDADADGNPPPPLPPVEPTPV